MHRVDQEPLHESQALALDHGDLVWVRRRRRFADGATAGPRAVRGSRSRGVASGRHDPAHGASRGWQAAHHLLRRPSRRLRDSSSAASPPCGRRQGHHVKFVSVTNGDIGHWREAGGPLARRRKAEVEQADRLLGITTEVLDIHDGELLPTLENRRTITRLIREWKADIVMSHRPNDYHPDHRYTGVLVQDAAYMVTVPFFCPDVPLAEDQPGVPLLPRRLPEAQPVPAGHRVSIDAVIEKKLDALDALESQFYEGGADGSAELIPTDPAKQAAAPPAGSCRLTPAASEAVAQRYRDQAGRVVRQGTRPTRSGHAEAFEVCEYGRRPNKAELARLFPFFGE